MHIFLISNHESGSWVLILTLLLTMEEFSRDLGRILFILCLISSFLKWRFGAGSYLRNVCSKFHGPEMFCANRFFCELNNIKVCLWEKFYSKYLIVGEGKIPSHQFKRIIRIGKHYSELRENAYFEMFEYFLIFLGYQVLGNSSLDKLLRTGWVVGGHLLRRTEKAVTGPTGGEN